MKRKTSNKDLPEELRDRNQDGRYEQIIKNALANVYHDFKSEEAMPKAVLVNDLDQFPELADIREAVINGKYDDYADEADKAEMRGWLDEDKAPDSLYEVLGLKKSK